MKKFYSLFAVALVASMPMVAQDDGPVRTDQDAREIFFQDFEGEWDTWSNTPVDSITKVKYYKHIGTDQSGINIYSGSADWEIYGERDTVMMLKNGVMTSDDAGDISKNAFDEDVYTIIADDDADRQKAFAAFGTDGGKSYFRYISGKYLGSDSQYSNGVLPNYRRNLFVRGLPIEDESSYRLTLYIKADSKGSTVPTFFADVMRGYFHSEKPFSMGIKNDATNYMYNNTFEYKKTEFTGDWEKVTFMTYYLNDSIANQFVFTNGYWWTSDEWKWGINETDTLRHIQQPDKFFVRLSFASDSTNFYVDNLSLTKSWIGGVEHYKDLLRVDFGYETNMDDLAQAAKAKTNIAAVELPGEYFQVWGYYHDEDNPQYDGWDEIAIASAEYHGDGYMYMWTEPDEYGDVNFDDYDTVLVSFTNPVDDPSLCLKYTGSTFPKALDVDWIKNGKLLPGFSNEISTENPYIGIGVYSMKNLPPVCQGLPYENGSFGLDGSIRELTLRFSRPIQYDNIGEASELAFCRVTKSGVKEIWTVKESNDSTTTFVRPASCTDILQGEYQFDFIQLSDLGTDYGDNVTLNYEFGEFSLDPKVETVLKSNFKAETTDTQAVPSSLAILNGKDGFKMGTGTGNVTKSRLFWTNEANGPECGFYVSGRAEGKDNGHMYYGLNQAEHPLTLNAGRYSISFAAVQWDQPCETYLYIYKYTFGDDPSQVQSMATADKTVIGTFTPAVKAPYSTIQIYTAPYGSWPAGYETFSFVFDVPENGNYVLEWEVKKNSTNGDMISDFEIQTVGGLSVPYVTKFNKAIDAAKAKLAEAGADENEGIYLGADYDSFSKFIDSYAGWKSTAPSVYDATVAEIDAATAAMQCRMDTVDLFNTTFGKVIDKLAEYDDEALVAYQELKTYQALYKLAEDNEDYDFAANSSSQITAMIAQFNDGIAALDARKAMNDKFTAKLAEMQALIEDSLAQKGIDEYAVLVQAYNDNKDADIVTPDDDELTAMYDAICAAKANYVSKVDYVDAKTRQIKELAALAEQLGYDFGGKADETKSYIETLQDNDPELENLLREAAILQIYKAFAAGNDLDGTDVSALMPNYFMYNEAIVDRDMENNGGTWRIKTGVANTTALPGWTMQATGGNWYPSKVKVGQGDGKLAWDVDGHVFAGGLRCGPQTQGTFSTTVTGLPDAYYWVGFYGYNQTSNVAVTILTDSVSLNPDKATKLKKFQYSDCGTDSVKVAGDLKISINQSSASGSEVDFRYFKLTLRGVNENIDYSALAAAQQQTVDELVTFVDANEAAAQIEYIGLDGVKAQAPKAGAVTIRVTRQANGRNVIEKVLVK